MVKNTENIEKTILVVEDTHSSSYYLKEVFRKSNINLLFAYNGKEAVEIYTDHEEISLILMDIKMPIMNGYEATKEIRELEVSLGRISVPARIPIIAVTGCANIKEKILAIEAGCDDHLSKPFVPQELKDKINKYFTLE